jgi:hypothetical protein
VVRRLTTDRPNLWWRVPDVHTVEQALNRREKSGGSEMFGTTDLIVYLWLLPVTLFIIVPLAMLCVWSVFQLVKPLLRSTNEAKEQVVQAIEGGIFSTSRV